MGCVAKSAVVNEVEVGEHGAINAVVTVENGVGTGEIGGVAGVEENGAGQGVAASESAGEVGGVVGGLDHGVVDGGAGDADPGDGVGIGVFELVKVNGLVGGSIAVAGGGGGSVGYSLVLGLAAPTVNEPESE